MNYRIFHTTILLMYLVIHPTFAQNMDTPPWDTIFNGVNFDGWKIIGSNGKAWVEDGAFVAHQVSNTPIHTFICTEKEYGDFIFEADGMIDSALHTGFLFRCEDATADTAKVSLYGYQMKIDPTQRRWTGGVFDDWGKTWEWYYPLKTSEEAREAFHIGEWNHFRIEAIGNHIKIWVNGVPTTNLLHNKYTKGPIAIKIHSMGDDPEKENVLMRYRNIRIIDKNPKKYSRSMGDYPLIDLSQE